LLLAQIYPWFGVALTITVSAAAFWKGGREEQLAAGGVLLSFAMTIALRDNSWQGTQWSAFVADVALLALIVTIALRSPRYWPLAAAAFQLICVMIHVGRMIDPGVRAWAYATGQVIFTQLYLVAIGVGTWNTWRGRQAIIEAAPNTDPGATRR
jgi:hypothetical protein